MAMAQDMAKSLQLVNFFYQVVLGLSLIFENNYWHIFNQEFCLKIYVIPLSFIFPNKVSVLVSVLYLLGSTH